MSQFNVNKNTPWSRNNSSNIMNSANTMQSQMINQGSLGSMNSTGMVQFQQQHQQQVFQNALGLPQQNLGLGLQQMANNAMGAQLATSQLFQQVGAVTYPNPRALNPTAFQTQPISAVPPVQSAGNQGSKQRVFTGTVTKVHDNFGFVDDDVFFQTSACVKGSNPVVGDRVLVEASYNPSMPFKWNATRIQVLPVSSQGPPRQTVSSKAFNTGSVTYNAVPPPFENSSSNFNRNIRPKMQMNRPRERSRERERDDEEIERKRRREERVREREKEDKKSPVRRRSRSPKVRRRVRVVPRYMVQIPKISLDLPKADVLEIRRRYNNLYIPSDFFYTQFRWMDAFPPSKPFALNKPCTFHVMSKDIDPLTENTAVLEPPDADYVFSAKVMLMSIPALEEIYQKCFSVAEDPKRDRDSEERDFVHPTRMINFLVGLRGKNETMAIGGPWSKSLDGEDPDKDPAVLIRTAIRTCKALTGVDLSCCTQWYRFVELYYRRSESTHKGKPYPARVETVVIYLPDVWSCLPTRLEWDALQLNYKKQLEARFPPSDSSDADADAVNAGDEKEDEQPEKAEPTHYSQLDPKNMSVTDLRRELKARSLNYKGLKSQLIARICKVIKSEAEKSDDNDKNRESAAGGADSEMENSDEVKKEVKVEERKLDEKERALLEKKYALPDHQAIIVHPSKTAKSGKFDCTTMSLSLLLDYRPEDTKEHSFEVSLFAELFNEMLMRDFGFSIYKALNDLPDKEKEKTKDKDDKRKKDDEKKSDVDKKKDEDKKKDDSKKVEDKKEDEAKKDGEKKSEEDKKKDEKKKSDEHKEDKPDEERKKDAKRDERRSESTDDEYDGDEDSRSSDPRNRRSTGNDRRRTRDRVRPVTHNKDLLLSFVYFDQSHCGYLFDRDLEDLLFTLGLSLSRAQVKRLVARAVTRESLHYRRLTDGPPKDEEVVLVEEEKERSKEDMEGLAWGNKRLLPVFQDGGGEEPPRKRARVDSEDDKRRNDDMIMFHGALVDVGKLMAQLDRSEKARIETESRMVDLKQENNKLAEKYSRSNSTIKHLNSEVRDFKEKLRGTEESLARVTSLSKVFHFTLQEVKDKIDPVLKSALRDEMKKEEKDRDREKDKEREKERERERDKDKERERDRDKDKEKEKEKSREKEKDTDRDNEKKADEAKLKSEEINSIKTVKDVKKEQEDSISKERKTNESKENSTKESVTEGGIKEEAMDIKVQEEEEEDEDLEEPPQEESASEDSAQDEDQDASQEEKLEGGMSQENTSEEEIFKKPKLTKKQMLKIRREKRQQKVKQVDAARETEKMKWMSLPKIGKKKKTGVTSRNVTSLGN